MKHRPRRTWAKSMYRQSQESEIFAFVVITFVSALKTEKLSTKNSQWHVRKQRTKQE